MRQAAVHLQRSQPSLKAHSAIALFGVIYFSLGVSSGSSPVSVRVLYPDRTPASHADVTITSACDTAAAIGETRTTDEHATLQLAPIDPNCNKVVVSASKKAEYWLSTCDDRVFPSSCDFGVVGRNGTISIVDFGTPHPNLTDISLGRRGGRVLVRVKDSASGRFLRSYVKIEQPLTGWTVFGYSGLRTSVFQLLVAEGTYIASTDEFEHESTGYHVDAPLNKRFVITAARTREVVLYVDTRTPYRRLSGGFVVPDGVND